jgi:FtsX extracellular domain
VTRTSLLIGSAVVLLTVVAVYALVLTGEETPPRRKEADAVEPPTTTVTPSALSSLTELCLDNGGSLRILVWFESSDADDEMRAAEAQLRGDDRISSLETETRDEAYVRFKEIFESRPSLVEQATPEALPASLEITPARGVDGPDLIAALANELTGEDEVEDQCELPPGKKLGDPPVTPTT